MSTGSRNPLTARELARLLGVSQSAISRAFTPSASISPDLRTRILASADKLGYRPNAIASSLSKRKSNIVGLLVSDLQNPFYPAMIEQLSRGLQQVGYQCLLFNVTPHSDMTHQLAALRQYNVDSVVIIVSAALLSGAALIWATEGREAILINRSVAGSRLTSVCCDNTDGARAVADHFHALGRKRVAFVGGPANTFSNQERQHAFIARLAELGITLTGCVDAGSFSYQAGYKAAEQLVRLYSTDAVFFANDIIAAGAMDALRDDYRVSIPEELAVAGFDDIEMAGWPRYALTTYRQPIAAIVDLSVRLLTADPDAADRRHEVHRLPGELIIRASTVPAGTAKSAPPQAAG
ncbi:MAG: LacI family DNA-binding transcriptional regulator [Microvirga sp.]